MDSLIKYGCHPINKHFEIVQETKTTMDTNFTVASLKINNKKNILDYIYSQKKTTPHLISKDLHLSRPTVAQILKEFIEEDIIMITGHGESTGGRKPNIYAFHAQKKAAIGVELRIDYFDLVASDLYGNMLKYERLSYPFSYTKEYFNFICEKINNFIEGLQISSDQILGISIALQALISYDGKQVVYGKILDCTGLNIDSFQCRLSYPCTFTHDAESAANQELWLDSSVKNAIFFNIHDNLSGAVIINGSFFRNGQLKSGVFEHMTLVPDGLPCYCGKKGCMNKYCSTTGFLKPEEDIDFFFTKLRENKPSYRKRWIHYLNHLAVAIDNLHMIIPSDVILGGILAQYLVEEDIHTLQQIVHERSAFPMEEQYIKISKSVQLPLALGATIPMIKKHLSHIVE